MIVNFKYLRSPTFRKCLGFVKSNTVWPISIKEIKISWDI